MLSASLRTGTTTETSGPCPLRAFVIASSVGPLAPVAPNVSRRRGPPEGRALLGGRRGPGKLFGGGAARARAGQGRSRGPAGGGGAAGPQPSGGSGGPRRHRPPPR